MLKYDKDMDPNILQCVNPHEITPLVRTYSQKIAEKDLVLNSPPGVNISPGPILSKSGNMEMEEFLDLESYLHTKQKCADELNTPDVLYGKSPFDFSTTTSRISSIQNVEPSPEMFPKWENVIIYSNNNMDSDSTFKQNDVVNEITIEPQSIETMDIEFLQRSELSPAPILNNNDIVYKYETPTNNISYPASPDSSITGQDYLMDAITPEHTNSPKSTIIEEQDHYYLKAEVITPENSNDYPLSPDDVLKDVPTKPSLGLNLNCVMKLVFPSSIPNTPDVIDGVVSLESERFNILDYFNEKELTTINEEDIKFSSPPPSLSEEQHDCRPKRQRKRKRYSDDDDDYVPPSQKSKKTSNYDSDSDTSIDIKPTIKKSRGRPRRLSSVSSDCSKLEEGSKYRELRDKNNEASRRSRLKRKVKEQEVEGELESLEDRNIKLKAQVEQLDKMVSNFRNNLFQVMLKK